MFPAYSCVHPCTAGTTLCVASRCGLWSSIYQGCGTHVISPSSPSTPLSVWCRSSFSYPAMQQDQPLSMSWAHTLVFIMLSCMGSHSPPFYLISVALSEVSSPSSLLDIRTPLSGAHSILDFCCRYSSCQQPGLGLLQMEALAGRCCILFPCASLALRQYVLL